MTSGLPLPAQGSNLPAGTLWSIPLGFTPARPSVARLAQLAPSCLQGDASFTVLEVAVEFVLGCDLW